MPKYNYRKKYKKNKKRKRRIRDFRTRRYLDPFPYAVIDSMFPYAANDYSLIPAIIGAASGGAVVVGRMILPNRPPDIPVPRGENLPPVDEDLNDRLERLELERAQRIHDDAKRIYESVIKSRAEFQLPRAGTSSMDFETQQLATSNIENIEAVSSGLDFLNTERMSNIVLARENPVYIRSPITNIENPVVNRFWGDVENMNTITGSINTAKKFVDLATKTLPVVSPNTLRDPDLGWDPDNPNAGPEPVRDIPRLSQIVNAVKAMIGKVLTRNERNWILSTIDDLHKKDERYGLSDNDKKQYAALIDMAVKEGLVDRASGVDLLAIQGNQLWMAEQTAEAILVLKAQERYRAAEAKEKKEKEEADKTKKDDDEKKFKALEYAKKRADEEYERQAAYIMANTGGTRILPPRVVTYPTTPGVTQYGLPRSNINPVTGRPNQTANVDMFTFQTQEERDAQYAAFMNESPIETTTPVENIFDYFSKIPK